VAHCEKEGLAQKSAPDGIIQQFLDRSLFDLICMADKVQYSSKKQGRNRVKEAETL
jgi:hypothetical protein